MNFLKRTFNYLVIFGLLFLVVSFFLPRHVTLEKDIIIAAPVRVVFSQVNDFHCWEKWSAWTQTDKVLNTSYRNSGIGNNAGYSWQSKGTEQESGHISIEKSAPYDSIVMKIDLAGKTETKGSFIFSEKNGQTAVSWKCSADLGMGPLTRWKGLTWSGGLTPEVETGLENLKTVSETIVKEKQPVVELINLQDFKYVSIRKDVNAGYVSEAMGNMYNKLAGFIGSHQLVATGSPYSIYHKIGNGTIDLEAGIPVNEVVSPDEGINTGIMKSKRYAWADHIGTYETLDQTHTFIQKWITKRNFRVDDGPMEQYLTDPQSTPDTSKWITAVYYPVQL